MRKQNVLEKEKRQKERREQIKTATLSKRFLAAVLTLVFIIGIIPTSIYFSFANADEDKNSSDIAVTETVKKDEEPSVKEAEEKKEETTEKKTEPKETEPGKLMMNIIKSGGSLSGSGFGPVRMYIELDDVEIGYVDIDAGKVEDEVNKDGFKNKIKYSTDNLKLDSTSYYDGAFVENNDGTLSKIIYAGEYKGTEYVSSKDNSVGRAVLDGDKPVLKYSTKYKVSCKAYDQANGDSASCTYKDGEFKSPNGNMTIKCPEYLKKGQSLQINVSLKDGYVIDKAEYKMQDKTEALEKNRFIEIPADKIKGDIELSYGCVIPSEYNVRSSVANGKLEPMGGEYLDKVLADIDALIAKKTADINKRRKNDPELKQIQKEIDEAEKEKKTREDNIGVCNSGDRTTKGGYGTWSFKGRWSHYTAEEWRQFLAEEKEALRKVNEKIAQLNKQKDEINKKYDDEIAAVAADELKKKAYYENCKKANAYIPDTYNADEGSFKVYRSNEKNTIVIKLYGNDVLKSRSTGNPTAYAVYYMLTRIKINGEKINLPGDPYAQASAEDLITGSGETTLKSGYKVRVTCTQGETAGKTWWGSRYRKQPDRYEYMITIVPEDGKAIDDDINIQGFFRKSNSLSMTLNCGEGIMDTAGTHMSVYYKYWAELGFFYHWDGGYNYFYALDHNSTGENIYPFYTAEYLNSRIGEDSALEKFVDEKFMKFNYKILGQGSSSYSPAEQYVDNVYMYKVKPGYNPYTVTLSNLLSDGADISKANGILYETADFSLNHAIMETNENRKLRTGTGSKFKPIYDGGPLMPEVQKGLDGEWKFNFIDTEKQGYVDPLIDWKCYQELEKSIQLCYYSMGRGYLRGKNDKPMFSPSELNNDDWFYGDPLTPEQKSGIFELGILKDTYAASVPGSPSGDSGITGQNYLHHHWGSEYHSINRPIPETVYFKFSQLTADDYIKLKEGKTEDYPKQELLEPLKSQQPSGYGGLARPKERSTVMSTEITDLGKKNKIYNFFPDVTENEDLGFYFGFRVPEAIKGEPYRENTNKQLYTYTTNQTPIAYGSNMEIDVNATPYRYSVVYDKGDSQTEDPGPYDIKDKNLINLPKEDPKKDGYEFVGWQLVKSEPEKEDVVYKDKMYSSGETFRLTDENTGGYNKKGVFETRASTKEKGSYKNDDGMYFKFRAVWKEIPKDSEKATYKVVKHTAENSSKDTGYTEKILADGTDLIGKKLAYLKDPETLVPASKDGKYYYYNKNKSNVEVTLGKDSNKNTMNLIYDVCPVLNITLKRVGEKDDIRYIPKDKKFPVSLNLNRDGTYAFKLKTGGKDIVGTLKYEGGNTTFYDAEGKPIAGMTKLELANEDTFTLYEMRPDENEKISISAEVSAPETVTYSVDGGTGVDNFNDKSILKDTNVEINVSTTEPEVTGILDNSNIIMPIAVLALGAYGAYVVLKNRKTRSEE